MGRFRKWLLWGVVMTPVAILSGGILFSKIWLNDRLNRDLVVGDTHIRLISPHLGWGLNFSADTLEVLSPKLSIKTGRLKIDIRLWQSLVSLKPAMKLQTQWVKVILMPDTSSEEERRLREAERKARVFPNLRIPIPFEVKVGQVDVWRGDAELGRVLRVRAFSQGPKGAALEADSLWIGGQADSLQGIGAMGMGGAYRISARWFGKSVKYQVKLQNLEGDYIRMEGSHRKANLGLGKDSVDFAIADVGAYTSFFPRLSFPIFKDISIQAVIAKDTHFVAQTQIKVTTPPSFTFGPQHLIGNLTMADSTGSIDVSANGDSGESANLHGRFAFALPTTTSTLSPTPKPTHSKSISKSPEHKGLSEWVRGFSSTCSGFTRGVRVQLGGKELPGDLEIRSLTIQSGLHVQADVQSKDGSSMLIRFHPGSILGAPASVPGPVTSQDSLDPWSITFNGHVSPTESWVHAWTDTNLAFGAATVSGSFRKGELEGEAWINRARAYGAVADSLYVKQIVHRDGYRLTASRLYWKDAVWPVTGRVDWGKSKKHPDQARPVSLDFQTRHKHFGSLTYAMPRKKFMEVKAEDVVLAKLPYPKIGKIMALQPEVSGTFVWDWAASTGAADINSNITYSGESLNLKMQGAWDRQRCSLKQAEVLFAGSQVKVSGDFRLHGEQFYQLRKLGIQDVEWLSLETDNFDAARLAVFLGPGYPVEGGMFNGRLTYTDTTGFLGSYVAENLELKPLRKQFHIKQLSLAGEGENLLLSMRTVAAPGFPWFNDSLSLRVGGILSSIKTLSLWASSDNGLKINFAGQSKDFRDLDGRFSVEGQAVLPGQGGIIQALSLSGHVSMPFTRELLQKLVVDSGIFRGRYPVPGLDTQSIQGTISVRDGHLDIPDLIARNASSVTLTGQAKCDFAGPFQLTARMRGENLKIKWPDMQKLVLQNADVSLQIDSLGLSADAKIGKAEFLSKHTPINIQGALENLTVAYHVPPAVSKGLTAPGPIAKLKVKTGLRGFLFQHKLGFREIQRFFRNVKVDKRKQRVKPIEVQISVETAGSANRIETDILRMNFKGDLEVHGIYPYTLLTGQFSALSGELGQSSQSYDITDFDLKWQNATVEEGRVSVEGGKRLRYDCKPDTKRTCHVYIKLDGRLDEMAFTYDSDCGGNSGNVIEPAALINSVSRGCYSDQYVAGAGGGNYGEAVVNFLEPAINEKLSSVGNRYSLGWIKSTQVSGIGTFMSGDSTGAEPISIGIESKEKWGMSLKAKAGYHPERELANPWENRVALEWRPPLERVAHSSTWKRRVRDRVMLEASAENRPEEKIGEKNKNEVRKQVGISYHYKFWDLW